MSDMIERAENICVDAHRGQLRRYTDEPYHVHPMAVRDMVKEYGGDEEMQAAALLHDVLEDTSVAASVIESACGSDVRRLVEELTEGDFVGNRAARKAQELERLSGISPEAKFIKLCDLIDNTDTISEFDPGFWRVYREEKRRIVEAFRGAKMRDDLRDGFTVLMEHASMLVS